MSVSTPHNVFYGNLHVPLPQDFFRNLSRGRVASRQEFSDVSESCNADDTLASIYRAHLRMLCQCSSASAANMHLHFHHIYAVRVFDT